MLAINKVFYIYNLQEQDARTIALITDCLPRARRPRGAGEAGPLAGGRCRSDRAIAYFNIFNGTRLRLLSRLQSKIIIKRN